MGYVPVPDLNFRLPHKMKLPADRDWNPDGGAGYFEICLNPLECGCVANEMRRIREEAEAAQFPVSTNPDAECTPAASTERAGNDCRQ